MTCTTPPWFPFYIGDYDHDTTHLSCEQHGAYFLLMLAYYRRGRALPDDNTFLASTVKLTRQKWLVSRPMLAAFFQVSDGWWRHKRIDAEIAEQQARSDEHSRAGRKGATKRWGNPTKSMPDGMARPSNANDTTCPVQNGQGNGQVNPTKSTVIPIAKPSRSHNADPDAKTACPVQKERGIEGSNSMKSMAPRWHTSQESSLAPYRARENSLHAREASPPLPSQGDGVAAPRVANPEPLTVFDDPALKAEVIDTLERCKDALRGKRQVLDADGAVTPPDPLVVAFRLRLIRLNVLAGERLTGTARLHAWEVIAAADAIGDPAALPPEMIADLAAIESLSPYAEAAE